MNQKIYRTYSGSEILDIPEDAYSPLIERILYKNDFVGIIGASKTNKSILAMQIACSLSSGSSFFGMFQVPEPIRIWYFATEGKDNDIKDRFMRMSKSINTNLDNIILFCSSQLKLNTETGSKAIDEILSDNWERRPQLIIIDSLYSGYSGKLSDDDVMNSFITKIRYMMEKCNNSAAIVVHHFKKQQNDKNGAPVHQDENSSYGSVFLLGQVDHAFTIEKCKKDQDDRIIKCGLQRSGKIIEKLRVKFNEPEPLYLSVVSSHKEEEIKIIDLLKKCSLGLTAPEILRRYRSIKKSLLYIVLSEMEEKRIIKNSKGPGGYNGKYTLLGA
jgi:hypothetical protein